MGEEEKEGPRGDFRFPSPGKAQMNLGSEAERRRKTFSRLLLKALQVMRCDEFEIF